MFNVVCQSVLGKQRTVRVKASSPGRATFQALKIAERETPGAGWRALYVL